jgi:hypothetical protein
MGKKKPKIGNRGLAISISEKVVHYNNGCGKVYFLLVKPFHKIIVRSDKSGAFSRVYDLSVGYKTKIRAMNLNRACDKIPCKLIQLVYSEYDLPFLQFFSLALR